MVLGYRVYAYAQLAVSVDETDPHKQERFNNIKMLFSKLQSATSFIESEIKELENETIERTINNTEDYKIFLKDLKRAKKYKLHSEVEKSLSALSPVLEAPYTIYNQSKLADLDFDSFEVAGREYSLSFVLFENEYQMEPDTKVRRKAFRSFSDKLAAYKNTMAAAYSPQVQKEKILSDMRGYDNIFDYFLFEQKVERELYDRQIDLIMEELPPHMRKYAALLKELYGLEEMTYADLKIPVDPDFEPEVIILVSRNDNYKNIKFRLLMKQ